MLTRHRGILTKSGAAPLYGSYKGRPVGAPRECREKVRLGDNVAVMRESRRQTGGVFGFSHIRQAPTSSRKEQAFVFS